MDHRLNFATQKFEALPKTAAVSHRMKAFCCNVPDRAQGRPPYYNSLTQRPGLSPKSPVQRHGIFGPSHASQLSKGGTNTVGKQKEKVRPIKQF